MERRDFGRTGMKVSVLGFGGAELGGEALGMAAVDQNRAARVLEAALDSGVNIIDTAECYGASEEFIGKALSSRRDEFFLFTKVGHPRGFSEPEDWTEKGILSCIEQSLKRLKTDRLDLVQLHSCDLEFLKRGEAEGALHKAREKGYTRFVGYSGDADEAAWAVEHGRFDSLQTSLSAADQEAIELTVPKAVKKGMGVIIKRPVANAAWRYGKTAPSYDYHLEYWKRFQALEFPFTKKPLEEAVAEALRFTLAVPGVCTAIVGTQNPDRFAANAKTAASALPKQDFEALRKRWKERAGADWRGMV